MAFEGAPAAQSKTARQLPLLGRARVIRGHYPTKSFTVYGIRQGNPPANINGTLIPQRLGLQSPTENKTEAKTARKSIPFARLSWSTSAIKKLLRYYRRKSINDSAEKQHPQRRRKSKSKTRGLSRQGS